MSATKDKMSILPSMVPTNVCLKIHLTPMDYNLLESRLKSAPTMILSLIIMVIHALHGMMMIAQVVVSTIPMISQQLMHVAHVEVDLNREVVPSQETHALMMILSLIRMI
jgi:hypothetical protein